MLTPEELDSRFRFHPPSHEGIKHAHEDYRTACGILGSIINELVPEGREKENAFNRLDEVMYWGNAGIARKQKIAD